ncbi:hypothetical protein HZ326_20962 [Fusarium oxysporum f. sp. albedinis]|nr:hypothetical protein HZ326_20962 [Fusarium oxysporum f. sp. albedinis]
MYPSSLLSTAHLDIPRSIHLPCHNISIGECFPVSIPPQNISVPVKCIVWPTDPSNQGTTTVIHPRVPKNLKLFRDLPRNPRVQSVGRPHIRSRRRAPSALKLGADSRRYAVSASKWRVYISCSDR